MRKLFLFLAGLIFLVTNVLAFTDPEPNPFASLKTGENIYAGSIIKIDDTNLTVKNIAGQEFTGVLKDIFKYRAGASVPDVRELAVGDSVRFIGTDTGGITVLQDGDLILTGVELVGRVSAVTPGELTLVALDYKKYRVVVVSGTAYFESPSKPKSNYLPVVGDTYTIHGVLNQRTSTIYALTLDTYLTILTAEQFAPLLAAAEQKAKVAIETAAATFPDLQADHPHRTAVGFVKSAGFVAGYPNGTFGAEKGINRAELAKILIAARFASRIPAKIESSCFTDVPLDSWFARFVCTAKLENVIGGNPDGTFAPSRDVNLAEGTKILLGTFGVSVTPATSGGAWYAPYLAKAQELAIILPEWTDPAKLLTRGEVAEMIYRATLRERNDAMMQ